ncbi:uncharacterized protein LOC143350243 [Colletes latitarsis]|uniref:uncharacterized protein LOC143350243 n=1 Tax=Colletes latitarsis TaxID=2605962 RepID=UPI004036E881
MYSDNGTTFHGPNRELALAHQSVTRDPNFNNFLASKGISWHFLPPTAPHIGGPWEAAVKSLKYHLKRTIGPHTASDCLEEYSVLTPGHFLIGSPLVAPPEPSVLNIQENRLSRWQHLQRLTEKLWKS